jgi:hypothetical protein
VLGRRPNLRKTIAIAITLAAALAVVPASAAAATTLGSGCRASAVTFNEPAAIQVALADGLASPTSYGVITKWSVNTNTQQATEALTVFRPSGAKYEAVAQSPVEIAVPEKTNEFAARLPIHPGELIGAVDVGTAGGIAFCYGGRPAGDEVGFSDESPTPGSTAGFSTQSGSALALTATVEPDADHDGYGDETQDACPTNAAIQTACPTAAPPPGPGNGTAPAPPATVRIRSAKLEGNAVAVKLTASAQAQVKVAGAVRGKAAAAPATVSVAAGTLGRAYLRLSKSTRRRLAKLPRKAHLELVVEAGAPGGTPASVEVALPGRKKPRHHRHRSH